MHNFSPDFPAAAHLRVSFSSIDGIECELFVAGVVHTAAIILETTQGKRNRKLSQGKCHMLANFKNFPPTVPKNFVHYGVCVCVCVYVCVRVRT